MASSTLKPRERRCRICGDSRLHELYVLPSGSIVRCLGCQTVFRGDLISGDALYRLYQDDAMMETPFYMSNKLAQDPDDEPLKTFARGLSGLARLRGPGRLLDVGCSYGAFLMAAQRAGWEAHGVELSETTARYAIEARKLSVFQGTVAAASFPDGHFDAVTLWDVLEHLDDPISTLCEIARILKPGGVLLAFTINQASLVSRIGNAIHRVTRLEKPLVLLYDVHHNFFFDPKTLRGLLGRVGAYDVVEIEYSEANVRRWRTVPIHPLMTLGSDVVDRLALRPELRYRMLVYARRRA